MKNMQHSSPVCFVFSLLFPSIHFYQFHPIFSPTFLASSYSPFLHLPSPCLCPLPLSLGLSKSFPLDNSLFDSWLAQSVQITADDMLSQWALGAQHRDKSGSLLSDQVGIQEQRAQKTMC